VSGRDVTLPRTIRPVPIHLPPRHELPGTTIGVLGELEFQTLGGARGPEDVVIEEDGAVLTGVDDGRILRVRPGRATPEVVADTGGRVLGIEPHPEGYVVCDAIAGVFLLEPGSGRLDLLFDRVDGEPLRYANNAAVGADGTIYVSQSSTRHPFEATLAEELEGVPSGRLLAHAPASGRTEVLASGLGFANGVAVDPGGGAVIVAESLLARLSRVPVGAGGTGAPEVLADLPGMPDNLAPTADGTGVWVALPAPRSSMLDAVLARPRLRQAIYALLRRLPGGAGAGPGSVVEVGFDGTVRRWLVDPQPPYRNITGAREHDGWLYLAGLTESRLARVRLPT